MTPTSNDPRVTAFCSAGGPEVFSSVAYAHQVWTRDPFDVEAVHDEARRAFSRLVEGGTHRGEQAGRILLVRGAAGSGKTHLIRAFRSQVHRHGLGFAGYMQMTSATSDYAQYTLTNLIDSLQHPYDPPQIEASGLMALSDSIAQVPGPIPTEQLAALAAGELPGEDPVSPLVDQLLRHPRLSETDPDLLRALIQLQRRDPPVTARSVKYLRCQALGDWDRRLLGGIADRTSDGDAMRTLVELAKLIGATSGGSLVLLVDQLEDIFHLGEAADRFPRAVDVFRSLVDSAPNVVVVVSCLDDMYEQIRDSLSKPALDRLETEPPPIQLTGRRSLDEIEVIVARRLAVLYEHHEVPASHAEPLFPLTRAALEPLSYLRTRDVINWCHEYQQRCIAAGRIVEPSPARTRSLAAQVLPTFNGAQLFNDARAAYAGSIPDKADDLLSRLESAAVQCDIEAGGEVSIQTSRNGLLELQLTMADGSHRTYAVGISNESTKEGALSKRIDEIEEAAGDRRPVLVRSSPFPDDPRTQIAGRLGEIVRAGGRRLVIPESDWRTMMAFESFRATHSRSSGYAAWIRSDKPLSQLSSLRTLFRLGKGSPPPEPEAMEPVPERPAPPELSDAPPAPPEHLDRDFRDPLPEGTLIVGQRIGAPGDIGVSLVGLTEHVGLVGQGARRATMRLVERAVAEGVPVVVLDPTGAYAAYAERDRLSGAPVDVFTPGAPEGRPVGLLLVPGMEGMRWAELPMLARQSAASLGALMRYSGTTKEQGRLMILGRAVQVLARNHRAVTIAAILDLVRSLDPELLHAVGHASTGLYAGLADHLEALTVEQAGLLGATVPVLDVPSRFVPGEGWQGRLSVITTRMLDGVQAEFWVSRLLSELGAWCARQRDGAAGLRALVVIDEAERALPSRSKPVTREPLRQLLRRGRASGLGVLLTSEESAELDASPQTAARWLVGPLDDNARAGRLKAVLARTSGAAMRVPELAEGEMLMLHDADLEAVEVQAPDMVPRVPGDLSLLAWAASSADDAS